MFEAAEIHHHVDKKDYEAREQQLRADLVEAQRQFEQREESAVVVVVGGVDGAGKGDTINLLNAWLDPHHVQTHGMGSPSDEERQRPDLWRFWRRLPPRGEMAIFFESWYTRPLLDKARGEMSDSELDQAMEQICRFEQMLADERVVLLKLWFHLSKKDQKKRFEALEEHKRTRWRVTATDWEHHRIYDEIRLAGTRLLRETSVDVAPWRIVPGAEPRFRHLTVGQAVLDALRSKPAVPRTPPESVLHPAPPIDGKLVLDSLDLSKSASDEDYDRELPDLQGELNLLVRRKRFAKRSLMVVFEGMDAAGKGGAIRRVTAALDARTYEVVPVAAPTDEEKARPYLWRFWRHAPRHGKVVVFDRSWYGRVLVERVESLCNPEDWFRAYSEINDFEEQLTDNGAVVVKLWLQIDPSEQLRRFEARENTAYKNYKLTPDDWRNRKRREDYELAVQDMIERTSTEIAPWTLIEADDKRFARLKVLRTITKALRRAL